MLRTLILFLVRRKLRLKSGERFRFANQKSGTDFYYIDNRAVFKHSCGFTSFSTVSLNWLLDPECKVIKVIRV